MDKKTLAELRAEKNMSQRKLAKELNISFGSIGMYESGKRTPPLSKAIKIAQFFDMPVEKIIFSNYEKKDEYCEINKNNKSKSVQYTKDIPGQISMQNLV